MKSSAITRIVLYSLAIVLLLGLLIGGLCVDIFRFTNPFGHNSWNIGGEISEGAVAGGNTSSSGEADAATVREIEIVWVAGSITVETGGTDKIAFSETGSSNLNEQMVWKQNGDKLTIVFCKDSSRFSFSSLSKDLTVTLPQDWSGDSFTVESVSARIDISSLHADELEIDNVSGACRLSGCAVQEAQIATVSGNVRFDGTARKFSCESVSADCELTLANAPEEIDMDSTSGNLTVTLPESTGFTATINAMSGSFSTDFSASVSGKGYLCGDGRCSISMNSVSGDLTVRKAA